MPPSRFRRASHFLVLSVFALVAAFSGRGADPALAPVADDPRLPRVLLLGDSISIGYTLPVRAALKDRANVHRPPTNCSSTGYGLQNLDAWLGSGRWDVIHFNFGLHDAKLPPEGGRHAPPDVYASNLRAIVRRLQATGAKLVWATTTPVPNGGNLAPNRRFGDIAHYNAIAARIMREEGVAINDLSAAITPVVERVGRPNDVHFTEAGSELLAKEVVAAILLQLVVRWRASAAFQGLPAGVPSPRGGAR